MYVRKVYSYGNAQKNIGITTTTKEITIDYSKTNTFQPFLFILIVLLNRYLLRAYILLPLQYPSIILKYPIMSFLF